MERPRPSQQRVVVQPPERTERNRGIGQPHATCFAILHPLHEESFTRYYENIAEFRRFRDHIYTRRYVAHEVAVKEGTEWVASQEDTFYGGGLWSGRERRFSPPEP